MRKISDVRKILGIYEEIEEEEECLEEERIDLSHQNIERIFSNVLTELPMRMI